MSTFGIFPGTRLPAHAVALRALPPGASALQPHPAMAPGGWHPVSRAVAPPPRGWAPAPRWRQPTTIIVQQPAPLTVAPPPIVTATPSPQMIVPPSMPEPQPNINPSSPTADLGPTQDAAAEAAAPPEEHPGHAIGRKIIIGLVVAGVAFGGYKFYQSRKKHAPSGHSSHAMHGARRRRRRR